MADIIDSIEIKLHADFGYEVLFTITEDDTGLYRAYADENPDTVEFLEENYPNDVATYGREVDAMPTCSSRYLQIINDYIERHTYNSIRPLVEDEDNWLELDDNELMKD